MRIDPTSLVNRADRLPLGRAGTMRDPGRTPIDVEIDNLSETGALLRTAGSLPVGTLISLGIAGIGMQMARISRVSPGELAAEFMQPLDPQAVARAASGEPLTSVAIPQLPGRSDFDIATGAVATEPAAILSLAITPLPTSQLASLQAASLQAGALTYDARGGQPVALPEDDSSRPVDPRVLMSLYGERRAFPSPPVARGIGLWLLVAAVLVACIAWLLL